MGTASLSDYFRCTFVINLAERKDRRRDILAELARAGMPLCDGKVELFPAVKPSEPLGFPNIGARGCFLSHLGILKLARERGLDNVLIVEDDLTIAPEIDGCLGRILADLDQDNWGMIYLGHRAMAAPEMAGKEAGNGTTYGGNGAGEARLVRFDGPLLTTHFYAVNGAVLPRLIAYLEAVLGRAPGDPLGGPMHVDGALSMFRRANPDVITLIADPSVGGQRPSRSNITFQWYEELPVVQQLVDFARAMRNRLRG